LWPCRTRRLGDPEVGNPCDFKRLNAGCGPLERMPLRNERKSLPALKKRPPGPLGGNALGNSSLSDPDNGNLRLPVGRVRRISAWPEQRSGIFFTAVIFFVHFCIQPKMHIPLEKGNRHVENAASYCD
jgi:hypothetical protein